MTVERLAFTVNEVANMLGISTKTVYRMVEVGKLKRFSVGVSNREFRISKESIDQLLGKGVADADKERSLQPDTVVRYMPEDV